MSCQKYMSHASILLIKRLEELVFMVSYDSHSTDGLWFAVITCERKRQFLVGESSISEGKDYYLVQRDNNNTFDLPKLSSLLFSFSKEEGISLSVWLEVSHFDCNFSVDWEFRKYEQILCWASNSCRCNNFARSPLINDYSREKVQTAWD